MHRLHQRLIEGQEITRDEQAQIQEIFTFPVKEYYLRAGFDFTEEAFDIPAHQFIDIYRIKIREARLHEDVIPVLEHFQARKYRQVILSAMEHDFLEESLKDKRIFGYFDKVAGIDNHYGASKVDVGKELLGQINHSDEKILLIGDTIHDHEVARELGLECMLVANGHQARHRLEKPVAK